MGLCVSKPMESSTESTKTTRNTKSKLTKSNSSVVQDPRSHKITRVNGASIKSLGNALFFPDKAMPCKSITVPNFVCRRGTACEYAHAQTNLTFFLDCLNSAEFSLDVCIFQLTCNEIAEAVTNAVKRGVRVRIITDANNVDSNGSDIRRLNELGSPNKGFHYNHKMGIQIRCDERVGSQECRTKPHMHHKFCTIDCGQSKKDYTSNTKLMNGSFNWTRQAVLENQDNVMVLEGSVNFPMINAYQQSFNMMWSKYERFVLPRAG